MAKYANTVPQLLDADWLRDQYEVQLKSTIAIAEELGCTPALVQYRLRQAGIKARPRSVRTRWQPKNCEGCGKEYTPTGPAHRFCSTECRVLGHRRACEYCGDEFQAVEIGSSYSVARFCSEDCRTAARLAAKNEPRPCEQCTKVFNPRPPKSARGKLYPQRFCSWACRKAYWAEHSAHEYLHKASGYVWVQIWDEEGGNAGRRLQHHWVMEQRLGRRLYPHEEVHHRNGHKDDNDRFCPVCVDVELPQELVAGMLQCSSCGSRVKPNLELWTTSQPKGQRVEDKIAWAREFLAEYGYVVTDEGTWDEITRAGGTRPV